MNMVFWSLMLLMLLVAIAILVYPLLKVRDSKQLAYKDSNLSIHRDKMNELLLDLEEGRIDRQHYENARNELNRELLADVPEESMDTATEHYTRQAKRQPALAVVIAVFVPLLAFLVYLDLGMHAVGTDEFQASIKAQQEQQAHPKEMSVPQMAERLLQHIKENGGGVQEWSMLGRAYKFMNRYDDASRAFAEALELEPENVGLLLERAEVIALENNRQFVPEARQLTLKALELEPNNMNALWFAGVAEFQGGEYRHAIDLLAKLAASDAVKDKTVRESVIAFISQARAKLVAQGGMAADEKIPELDALLAIEADNDDANVNAGAATAGDTGQVQSQSQTDAGSGAVLHVQVDISPDVKQKFTDSADVFVYAKAKNGPRFPLAVKRMKLAQFPATVVLDDSMAMIAGMNLSAFGHVMVSARVTTSGSAIAQPGDYIGSTEVADVSTADKVAVTVSEIIN